ncbi:MAG: PTS beta-glucoside transporter subunit EIIBCA, partial [Bacillus sp. (in: firmicutes)]
MNAINTNDASIEKKETVMNKILGAISGSFAPILGVLAGSGLISALLSILSTLGWLSAKSGTYAILSAAGHAVFYFFPVF